MATSTRTAALVAGGKVYGRNVAQHILDPLMEDGEVLGMLLQAEPGMLVINDAGVWPQAHDLWLPAMELDAPVDLSAVPGLPFRFSHADLAAFMVNGLGHWVREFYTSDDGEINEDQVNRTHVHANVARDAIRGAHALFQAAVDVVGDEPDSNDRPVWQAWCRAMVRKLQDHGADQPAPTAPMQASSGHAVHRMLRRSDSLSAVIELATESAVDREDWPSVWAALIRLAEQPRRPAPLLGYSEGEGVKYEKRDHPDGFKHLTREAFRKRHERTHKDGGGRRRTET
jgi:hypothetical protein